MSTTPPLLDTDGENRPVRWFLAAYGGAPGMTVGKMKKHLTNCGYPFWPTWCDEPNMDGIHLTKGGAQAWLRHLFSLEKDEAPAQPVNETLGEVIGCFDAAIGEGLLDAIAETTDERLKDLLERRVMHAYHKAIGPELVKATSTTAQSDAEEVLAAMNTCEWSVRRNHPANFLTDEANREFAWTVQRESAPYCDKEGNRYWTGPTAIEALRKAKQAITSTTGNSPRVEPPK